MLRARFDYFARGAAASPETSPELRIKLAEVVR
jgi:hypothetical protein